MLRCPDVWKTFFSGHILVHIIYRHDGDKVIAFLYARARSLWPAHTIFANQRALLFIQMLIDSSCIFFPAFPWARSNVHLIKGNEWKYAFLNDRHLSSEWRKYDFPRQPDRKTDFNKWETQCEATTMIITTLAAVKKSTECRSRRYCYELPMIFACISDCSTPSNNLKFPLKKSEISWKPFV